MYLQQEIRDTTDIKREQVYITNKHEYRNSSDRIKYRSKIGIYV